MNEGDYEDAAFALISTMKTAIMLLQRAFVHTATHTCIRNSVFIVLVYMCMQHATCNNQSVGNMAHNLKCVGKQDFASLLLLLRLFPFSFFLFAYFFVHFGGAMCACPAHAPCCAVAMRKTLFGQCTNRCNL